MFWKLLKRRLEALVPIGCIAMVTEDKTAIRCITFSITLTTGVFPRSSLRMSPTKVSLSEFKHPSVIQAFKLLRHVVSYMPDCRAVFVVYLTVVPHLKCTWMVRM